MEKLDKTDKYEEQILTMLSSGRISADDATKLLNFHYDSDNKKAKAFYSLIKKDISEKFRYLITLELPEEEREKNIKNAKNIKNRSTAPGVMFESFETTQKAKTLSLTAYNGRLNVNQTINDSLLLKVGYEKKTTKAAITLTHINDTLSLNYDERHFENLSIDAMVPKHRFETLSLGAINGYVTINYQQ
ncbi:MAG: hypothetical protein FWG63_08520 [Defluviitaleaceae bacterium]|nr:hypothetical protein [Defluviitaleaceae bacterium]